jgi:hypothetical protein
MASAIIRPPAIQIGEIPGLALMRRFGARMRHASVMISRSSASQMWASRTTT